MSWDEISYVIASKTRRLILPRLETPRTPTFLAKDLNINLANISRALAELEDKGAIICLTPEQKVGKIYSITKKGKVMLVKMKKMEEA